jgi:hypothetical protein
MTTMTALRLLRNERGMSMVFVSISMAAFLAATTLAIDVGMLMTARTQAQTSADAAALAGATALAFNDFDNRTPTGPAVISAINTGKANHVIGHEVSLTSADVTFPPDPATGQNDLVQVTVYRTQTRGNPLQTLMGQWVGVSSADVQATATAQAAPANAAICVLPFTIPDKWIEKQCGTTPCPWSQTYTYDKYVPNPDIYIPPGQTGATGYDPVLDRGMELVLKSGNEDKPSPSWYSPWDLPGSVGGDDYRGNIAGCNPNLVTIGNDMTPENGNMVGPTHQGTDDLIASDSGARWDTGCNCVKGSMYPVSPRIRILPLYDPGYFADGKQSGKSNPQLRVVNYLGFFIEDVTGSGTVTGRITPILGKYTKSGPNATGGFARALMLVK